MILIDVNVLIYAHRQESEQHSQYKAWLEKQINEIEPFGISELVLSAFIRIVTHPKIFKQPTPLMTAVNFTKEIRQAENCILINPGPNHWNYFLKLLKQSKAKGNLVPDAYHAALAIESGCEWISTDQDFSRFKGLKYRHPFD